MTELDHNDCLSEFKDLLQRDVAVPVCAMKTLVSVIKKSKGTTWMQLEQELRSAISELKECSSEDLMGKTKISLGSGCDLFMKYVTRSFLEYTEFEVCKNELIRRGESFAGMSESSRASISHIGHSFIQDGYTVLTHGNSRVVMALLLKAAEKTQFNIIVTEAGSNGDGHQAAAVYSAAGIPTSLVADCAVGIAMEGTDLCIVGAEGVMENGGVVNKAGTFQVAMIAKTMKKPFYVAVESYKFSRMYPLSQKDATDLSDTGSKATCFDFTVGEQSAPITAHVPVIDFTPAEYITLLFTDLGVLTPAAVSDELIRLYQ
mmetsp:Transcript_16836/g.25317  ORF Transcript_16836/g.25317 Transcript_16836/m.25317 type:complete len:317 (+) Transcript_16836:66-1016(+)